MHTAEGARCVVRLEATEAERNGRLKAKDGLFGMWSNIHCPTLLIEKAAVRMAESHTRAERDSHLTWTKEATMAATTWPVNMIRGGTCTRRRGTSGPAQQSVRSPAAHLHVMAKFHVVEHC